MDQLKSNNNPLIKPPSALSVAKKTSDATTSSYSNSVKSFISLKNKILSFFGQNSLTKNLQPFKQNKT